MSMVQRIFIVAIILIALLVAFLDYFGFHGSLLLGRVADGAIVSAIDAFLRLFEGKNAFTNLMFIGILSIGLFVGIVAIMYKFIRG